MSNATVYEDFASLQALSLKLDNFYFERACDARANEQITPRWVDDARYILAQAGWRL